MLKSAMEKSKDTGLLKHPVSILLTVLIVTFVCVPLKEIAATSTLGKKFSSNVEIESPLTPLNRGLITHGDRSKNKIALTFDLCQAKGNKTGFDSKLINILTETGTPATFFLCGLWIQDHMAESLILAGNPLFELGNHSWSHLDFSRLTPRKITEEIRSTQYIMRKLLGCETHLFRLPYGKYSQEALDVIDSNGLYTIQWDVVSGDPDPDIDATMMTREVLRKIRPGSIVIMHANGRGWHTAEALPEIIQSLKRQGYTFVIISDLLELGD